MSVKKVKINLMDLSLLMDENPLYAGMVLNNLMWDASMNTKVKLLEVDYDGALYLFELEDKTIRRDVLELTYRFKGIK